MFDKSDQVKEEVKLPEKVWDQLSYQVNTNLSVNIRTKILNHLWIKRIEYGTNSHFYFQIREDLDFDF